MNSILHRADNICGLIRSLSQHTATQYPTDITSYSKLSKKQDPSVSCLSPANHLNKVYRLSGGLRGLAQLATLPLPPPGLAEFSV
jgi:hypothetical protein